MLTPITPTPRTHSTVTQSREEFTKNRDRYLVVMFSTMTCLFLLVINFLITQIHNMFFTFSHIGKSLVKTEVNKIDRVVNNKNNC